MTGYNDETPAQEPQESPSEPTMAFGEQAATGGQEGPLGTTPPEGVTPVDPLEENLAQVAGPKATEPEAQVEEPTETPRYIASAPYLAAKPKPARPKIARVLVGAGVIAAVVGAAAGFGGYKLAQSSTPTTTAAPSTTAISQNTSVITSNSGSMNIQAILAKVEPAVVDISTTGYQSNGFFGGTSEFQAAGTGMIMTSSGEVLTNAHVIANASTIKVTLLGQTKSYNAKVIGSDTAHDVAVIQIEGAPSLPTVTFGTSSSLQVGDSVVAIGNALALQGLPTVTQGIVSGLHRSLSTSTSTLSDLIQTDAPINPGNSGGPLVNAAGQVVGMNTAIIASTGTETTQNLGFAEAIDSVLPIVKQIEAHPNSSTSSTNAVSSKAYLGVAVQNMNSSLAAQLGLPSNTVGALVDQVVPGSPADLAGIAPGSVITKVGSTTITSDSVLVTAIQSHKPGDSVNIYWVDSSGQYNATVTLGSAPSA